MTLILYFRIFRSKLIDTGMPIARPFAHQQTIASKILIQERRQHVTLAIALSNSTEPILLKPKLLFDYTKWVLNFGPDVHLYRLY